MIRRALLLRALLLVLSLAAGPRVRAEEPVDGAEFGAFARGWTLHFERDGERFGAESFDKGRGVVWRPEGGGCERGVWGADGARICFLYPGMASCWRMFRDAQGLFARSEDDPDFVLRVVRRDRAPVLCPGGPSA